MRSLLVACCLVVCAGEAAAQYKEAPVSFAATIVGHVRIAGEVPVLPPQPVMKETETCGTTVPDERLVTGKDAALRNVVVYLRDIKVGKPMRRDQPAVLDNLKCAFVPHVLSTTVGQTLQIHNSDPFLHDAHAMIGAETIFNLAIPTGRTVHRTLELPGLMHLNCNVRHTWMHAYVFVFSHPYHVVSNEAGDFRLEDVPPGHYTLVAWHELLGTIERPVTVESDKTATVDFAFHAAAADGTDGKPEGK